ncbi:MAG: hypothetical protein CM1200mP39_12750 [Dehalococcoidia bacterium]|nr:MAG: hypothetical protein CM1200mP39_12750 [Dehalococcoidia bacterium]
MELTNGIGADKVIEVVGFPPVVEEGLKMVRMRGVTLRSDTSHPTRSLQSMFQNWLRIRCDSTEFNTTTLDNPEPHRFPRANLRKYPLPAWFPRIPARSNRQGIRNSRMVRYPGRQRSHSSRGRPIINFQVKPFPHDKRLGKFF